MSEPDLDKILTDAQAALGQPPFNPFLFRELTKEERRHIGNCSPAAIVEVIKSLKYNKEQVDRLRGRLSVSRSDGHTKGTLILKLEKEVEDLKQRLALATVEVQVHKSGERMVALKAAFMAGNEYISHYAGDADFEDWSRTYFSKEGEGT